MSFDPINDTGLHFVPLGGSEQFGMNLNLYVCDGDFMAIDCGIGFADDHYPGIDLLLPDPAFIAAHKDQLKGLIVTHAHEDHIGAVARLWDDFECPVYVTKFTAAILREKFKEEGIKGADIRVVDPLGEVQIGAFGVQFIPVTHSVPGTASILIKTEHGNVLHSGDWNLDPAPVIGGPTDSVPFQSAGDEGILAYVGDSTNAGVSGRSGSEADVRKGLEAEFKKAEGKVIVTMFSSNISRVHSILNAAEACGRQVAVIGRSLHRMIGCAVECGYLDGLPEFISEKDLGYLPDENVVMILTGSQGESRAALAKVARGDHRHVSLKSTDTVIFSARAIPGNDKNINQVKNNLSAGRVTVITPDDTDHVIHVSGHPCQDEIADMLQWVRPKTLIPVHGERMQLDDHAEFAKACQIKDVVVPKNGSVIKISAQGTKIVDHISGGVLAVDPRRLISSDHASIAQRRKLQYTGAVHITVALGGKGRPQGPPQMDVVGLIDEKDPDEAEILDELHDEIMDILHDIRGKDKKDVHFVSEEIRIGVRRFFSHILGIKPKTSVHVVMV